MSDHPYVDTVEHRAGVYSLAGVPEMREWRKADFLAWIERHDAEVRADALSTQEEA